MRENHPQPQDWLSAKGQLVERPFTSNVPLIGPFIARFRTGWLNMAARWYIRPMMIRQSEFNDQLVDRIRDVEEFAISVTTEQDRELNDLRHDLAALRLQTARLNRRLHQLDSQLAITQDRASEEES